MRKFKVVSVDMFGTLANIDSVASAVWRTFLKDAYTDELGKQYWDRASKLMFERFDRAIRERRFTSFEVIYKQSYAQLFPAIGLDFDPAEAAQILSHHQSLSRPFDDVAPFLGSVGKHYPICVSSDTDDDMLGQLRRLHPFDNVFTSESLGTYKADVGGRFFAAVVAHYHEEPGRIIHIGDSVYDVTGAKEAGIVTCWLNRNGNEWSHETKPDYEVKSLFEAAALLEAESV